MTAFLRTLITTLIFAAVVLFAFWKLFTDEDRRARQELAALNQKLQHQLAHRDAMIQRLSATRRLAHIEILGQSLDENSNIASTELLLIELNERGSELARQQFTIPGNILFIDAQTIRFDHEHVAEGHPLFGRTLVLLRRIYSDHMAPADGISIDTPGAIPPGYASTDAGRYEQRLWESFWEIATSAELAHEMGVRVAQGEAVYKPVRAGEHYELIVEAAGGMALMPINEHTAQLSHAPK